MYICMPAYVDVKSESDKNDRGFLLAHRRRFCVSLLLLRSPKDSFTSTMHNIKNDIPHSPQRRKYKNAHTLLVKSASSQPTWKVCFSTL